MSLPEGFLEPISAERPSGEPLRYTALYDQITEARRQDNSSAQGVWVKSEVKSADFRTVEKLASDALKKKSKDIQIAVWLAEAWIYKGGLSGLQDGLELVRGLLENFWESLHPEIEDGDFEIRTAPLEWLGNYFDPARGSSPCLAVVEAPLNASGHGFLRYQQSRVVPSKADAEKSGDAAKRRDSALAEGKISPEDFDAAFTETPKAFYKGLTATLASCRESLHALDEFCTGKFGKAAPSFHHLSTTLEEIENLVRILLQRKLEVDPDPIELTVNPVEEEPVAPADGGAGTDETAAAPREDDSSVQGLMPRNKEEAVLRILAAAHFLRKREPQNPASYLILRGLRWGEILNTDGQEPDPNLLVAPSTSTRLQLRRLAAANQWADLLEASEQAMGTECGRAWLDLQRYSVKACESLGYNRPAAMIRSALKRLLSESPKLPAATLSDDTGTANPDTLSWLSGLN